MSAREQLIDAAMVFAVAIGITGLVLLIFMPVIIAFAWSVGWLSFEATAIILLVFAVYGGAAS